MRTYWKSWLEMIVAVAIPMASIATMTAQTSTDESGREEVEELIAQLGDEKDSVRRDAAWSLGQIGSSQAIRPLLSEAVQPLIGAIVDASPSVRTYAAYALGQIGDPRALQPLINALRDSDSNVRLMASNALGKLGDTQAVPALNDVLKDEEERVRKGAANALRLIANIQRAKPGASARQRRIRFPADRSSGRLWVRDWGSSDPNAWVHLSEARGNVVVPGDKELRLVCSGNYPGALRLLTALRPSDVQSLDLRGTRITNRELVYLEGLTALRELNLQGTQISDAGLSHLKGLTSLKALSLGNTRVADAGLADLKDMNDLEYLCIRGTRVTDAGLVHLRSLVSLKTLDLRSTRVEDSGLVHLKSLTALQKLDLQGTRVTQEGVSELKQSVTKCTVSGVSGPARPQYVRRTGPQTKPGGTGETQPKSTLHTRPATAPSSRYRIPTSAPSDSFSWRHIHVDIEMQEDGNLLISEEHKYSFSTRPRSARYRWFPTAQLDDIRDVEVYQLATNGKALSKPLRLAHRIERKTGEFWIHWSHTVNPPETHTFLLRYRVVGGLRIGRSRDELYWKAIAKHKPAPVAQATVRVHLPRPLRGETDASLGDGIQANIETSPDGSMIEFRSVGPIPLQTGLEVGVSFPHRILSISKPQWQTLWGRSSRQLKGLGPKEWPLTLKILVGTIVVLLGAHVVTSLVTGDWGGGGGFFGGGFGGGCGGGCGGGGCGGGGCGGGGCGGGGCGGGG